MFSGIDWFELIKQLFIQTFDVLWAFVKLFFILAWAVWPIILIIIILNMIIIWKVKRR